MNIEYAKIKPDVFVGHDFSSYRWPKVPCPRREYTRDMIEKPLPNNETYVIQHFLNRIFKVTSKTSNMYTLRAKGFGVLDGGDFDYGCGSLAVSVKNLIPCSEYDYARSEASIDEYVYLLKQATSSNDIEANTRIKNFLLRYETMSDLGRGIDENGKSYSIMPPVDKNMKVDNTSGFAHALNFVYGGGI